MCEKCDDLDRRIERYRRLSSFNSDELTLSIHSRTDRATRGAKTRITSRAARVMETALEPPGPPTCRVGGHCMVGTNVHFST
jgi:hypothetical protein